SAAVRAVLQCGSTTVRRRTAAPWHSSTAALHSRRLFRYALHMLPSRGAIIASLLLASTATRAQGPAWIEAYRAPVDRIISAATGDDFAWQRLAYLTDTFGNRL